MHRLELENLRESEPQQREHPDSVVATESVLPALLLARAWMEHAAVSGAPPPSRQGSGGSCNEGTSIHPGHMPPMHPSVVAACARSMRSPACPPDHTGRAHYHNENDACPKRSAPVKASLFFNRLDCEHRGLWLQI